MDAKKDRQTAASIALVSIHAPVMDAKLANTQSANITGFNPRARDGREYNRVTMLDQRRVSIHAPVMDANLSAITASVITQTIN